MLAGFSQECHLVIDRGDCRSCYYRFQPNSQTVYWLAYLQPELAEKATAAIRLSDGSLVNGKSNPFYDPDNTRQRELVITREEVAV